MMFSSQRQMGWIEVITGPMFSGKSEELIRRLKRAVIAKQRVMVFKPEKDDRYDIEDIVSHSNQRFTAIPVSKASEITGLIQIGTQVVAIDEAQFFGEELVRLCEDLANRGLRVIAAGLDLDFKGVPFSPIPELMAIAESISKLQAICMRCGAPAARSQRLTTDTEQVVVGASSVYEARCRLCYEPPSIQQGEESCVDLETRAN